MSIPRLLCWLTFLMVTIMPAFAKTGRTWYTDAKLAQMRSNLQKYEWAQKQQAAVIAEAERWAKYDDARLRTLVIPPQVPRGYEVHNDGCPIHGLEINKRKLYDWEIDFDRPFKIKCPVGGEEYPSNDFAAYLASGMQDKSLLTGPYADDGWGWVKEGDNRHYWFVAYYAHWSMRNFLMPAIRSLSTAAVVTQDPVQARRYAHKCALLLWQLATYYPDYEYSKQSREGKEHNPNYTGKLWNMIWEIDTPLTCAPAYDAVWPYLREDKDLQQVSGLSGDQLDEFIRQRLLREAVTCIMDGTHRIAGNYGTHQNALVTLAVALDDSQQQPTSQEMIQWVLANGKPTNYQDLGIQDALENMVYRDGMPFESIGYNYGWLSQLAHVAVPLLDAKVNFFEQRRFQRLLTWPMDILIAGKFWAPLGDSGDMFSGGNTLSPELCAIALPYVQDPRMAESLRAHPDWARDLFGKPAEELLAQFPPQTLAPQGFQSFIYPAYGMAVSQSGNDVNHTATLLHYGSWPAHTHADQLSLLLYAWDNPLLCDIGYPEQTDAFNHQRAGIWANTSSHNTVMVDQVPQERGLGKLYAYEPNGFAQVIDASTDSYPGKVDLYRRAAMQVALSPEQTYIFDVFHVRGGQQHDFFSMGPQAEFSCNPPLGEVQKEETLAGQDVPWAQYYDDPNLKDKPLGSVSYSGYRGSGFQYFFNVQRAPLHGQAIAEWRLTEPKPGQYQREWQGVALRAHLVGQDQEIIAADCKPQGYKTMPESVKYLLRRRAGDKLESTFITVYEPYKDKPFIKQVTAATVAPNDGQAVAVLVELLDGRRQYLFHSLEPGRRYTVDGKLAVDGQAACLALDAAGKPQRTMLLNGNQLTYGQFTLKGQGLRRSTVAAVDYANGTISLKDPVLGPDLRVGQTVVVAPQQWANSVTIRKVIDARRFSVGDEDLQVAGGPVQGVTANRIMTAVTCPNARPGMTVTNGWRRVLGKLAEGEHWTIDRGGKAPLQLEDFPTGQAGGLGRFRVMMLGPGDEVVVPSLALYEASAKP